MDTGNAEIRSPTSTAVSVPATAPRPRRSAPLLSAADPAYGWAFDATYPELAASEGVLLYPFFLDGVATDAKLNLSDGMHPSAAGVDVIVERILPKVQELIERAKSRL
jgi:acyl-CoA thioesterase-1